MVDEMHPKPPPASAGISPASPKPVPLYAVGKSQTSGASATIGHAGNLSDTLISRMMGRVEEAPQRTAFEFIWRGGAESIDQRRLFENADLWARHYRRLGLSEGDLIIIIIDHRPQLLYAYLGAMLAGCIPSYMPYSILKQDRRLYIKAHFDLFVRIGARAVVTTHEWLADFGETLDIQSVSVVLADTVGSAARQSPLQRSWSAPRSTDVALLQHSSGTTALKKGVALTHEAILAQADAYGAAISIGADDVIVSWLPLYHDMGLMACFILPLINGLPVVLIDPFVWVREPYRLFEAIEQYGGTLTWLPNFAYHHLCRSCGEVRRYELSGMRAFINCSEPCKAATFHLFLKTFARMGVRPEHLQTCYAMAENCFAVTQSPLGRPPQTIAVDQEALSSKGIAVTPPVGRHAIEFLSCGGPIDNVAIRIVDAGCNPLPEGHVGEIAVSGASLFAEYFRLPEETERVMRSGWYCTGDLGFVRDGELYVTGRVKDLIIIRGRNFYAHDIEYATSRCPGVKPGRAVALGVFNDALGSEEVVVVAEQDETDDQTAHQLAVGVKRALDQELDLQVRSVHAVRPGWLIKTTSGKISRSENLAKYLAETRSLDQAT